MSLSMRSLIAEFDKQWDRGLDLDVGEFVAAHAPLSLSQLTQVLLVDQSRRWASGFRVSAEDYFNRFPDLLNHAEGVIDLLFAEFILREESEATVSVDDYANRFPQFADEFRKQIHFHRTIGAELLLDGSLAHSESKSRVVEKNEVPGYEILGELGRGGLGVVYLARNIQLNRKVALKMLLAGKFASNNLLKRLLLEAEATARLQHPNIVQIYEVGQYDGHPFLALEYLSGGTLAEWMERRPQSPRDSANIIREVALAIQFAHENGVIHRDLKPSNLLIQPMPLARTTMAGSEPSESFSGRLSGRGLSYSELQIKIADFGLAKFVEEDTEATRMPTTLTGDLIGTAAYMSPEQAQSGLEREPTPLTASTDIYSLGAILYELLTGRPPFVGVQPLEVLSQVIADEPVRPSHLVRHIPKDLQTICLKCLEKSPVRRYASASALADDLQRFLSNQPIVARHTMMLERGWRWCRRNPVKTSLTALVATLLLMVALVSSVYSIMLGNQLAITSKSEITEKTLKIQAIEQLWESSISQADALRTSRQVGQRFESLKAIEKARELGKSIDLDPNQIDRMRNATLAALALSDIRIYQQWKRPESNLALSQSIDDELTVSAYLLEPTVAVVQRISDGVEVICVESVMPESRLVLSPDGSKLAIFKNICRVYDLNTTSHELLFESSSSGPWTFSNDGKQLIGTDGDGELKVVDLQTPQSIKKIGNYQGKNAIAISPDSSRVAMWIDDSIQVIELDTGKVLLRAEAPGLTFYQSFTWHPNSNILAIRSDQRGTELWDVGGGERLRIIPAHGPGVFAFDRTGNRLLTYHVWSENMQLWDVISGEEEFSQKGQHFHHIAADSSGGFKLIQSIDSDTVARVSILCPTVYQTIPAMRKDSAKHGVVDLSYSHDGRFFACSSRNELEIFDAHSMTSLCRSILPGCYIRFDFDGSLVTSNDCRIDDDGYRERGINRWKLNEGKDNDSSSRVSFGPPEVIYDPQTSFSNAPIEVGRVGGIVAVPMGNGVSLWSKEHSRSIQTQAAHSDVRRVSIRADGKSVASGGWNGGNVCIWDAETGQLQHKILEPTECTVQFSPDGKLLATNSRDIKVWDTQSWKELYKVKVPGQPNSGVSVCFSPDSKTLAASDSLGRIHLIESISGREFMLLTGPTEKQINSIHYSPDGRQLAVLPGDGITHVWKLDAIQAELDARNLGWQAGEGILPRSRYNVSDELSATKSASSKLPAVEIVFDERFRQLEATQQIEQANSAAAKFEFDSARVAIVRALALKPQDPTACNNLAWLLATGPIQLRDPQKAIELARTAMQNEADAKRGWYANTLGVSLYRAGQFDDAFDMLKQSLAMQASDAQAFDLYFLSMCKSRLGDHAIARDLLERAEKLKSEFRSKLRFEHQAELDDFSVEARSLLEEVDLWDME